MPVPVKVNVSDASATQSGGPFMPTFGNVGVLTNNRTVAVGLYVDFYGESSSFPQKNRMLTR